MLTLLKLPPGASIPSTSWVPESEGTGMEGPIAHSRANMVGADLAIIVPVFNSASYLPDLFDSLKKQTCRRFGAMFIDDGSTDASLQLLRDWENEARELGIPCSVFHKDNGGQSSARNVGIDQLRQTGPERPTWTLFVDSDDLLSPNAVETLLGYADEFETDVLLYGSDVMYESNQLDQRFPEYHTLYRRSVLAEKHVYSGVEALSLLFKSGQFVAQPCLQVLRTSFLLDSGIRFEEGIIHEDNLFSAQCLLRAPSVLRIEQHLYIRRIRAGSTMTKPVSWKNVEGYFICAIRLLQLEGRNIGTLGLVSEISNTWLDQATSAYRSLPNAEKNKRSKLGMKERPFFEITVLDRLRRTELMDDALASRDALQKELGDVRGSLSFRVGRALTSVPRWLRDKLSPQRHE